MQLNFTQIRRWHLAAALFTLAAGTALHFLTDWTGGLGAALFGPVNESIWEHLKLLLWPVLAMTAAEYMAYGYGRRNFIQAKAAGLLAGLVLIPALYSAARPLVGMDSLPVNILIFAVSAAVVQLISFLLLKSGKGASPLLAAAAILFITALALLFVRYTFEPPHTPLFQDPLTGRYGLEGAANAESFVPLLQNL